jgi:enoyl-CoA hydratase/carnithine racemase
LDAFDTILYSKDGALATITLNRPGRRNAFNTVMRDDLWQVLDAARDDEDVRCIILNGAGPDFCAGADLTEFGTAPSVAVARRVRWERDVWGLFLNMPKPLIAAIHGHCIGSGLEVSMLCDLRIASEDAAFSMPETRLGLIPAAGGTQTLPRSVGLGTAMDLLLTGRAVLSMEALELGIVTKLVTKRQLMSEASNLASILVSLKPAAIATLKESVRQGIDLPLDKALELDRWLALKLLATQSH